MAFPLVAAAGLAVRIAAPRVVPVAARALGAVPAGAGGAIATKAAKEGYEFTRDLFERSRDRNIFTNPLLGIGLPR